MPLETQVNSVNGLIFYYYSITSLFIVGEEFVKPVDVCQQPSGSGL